MIQIEVTDPTTQLISFVNAHVVPNRERMRRVAERVMVIIRGNFLVSGRPEQWPLKRDGSHSQLLKSGTLINSGRVERLEENGATIEWGRGVPYARIHNDGGVINHPGSDKRQVFEIGGQVIVTNFTKPHAIPIPKREYMTIPPGEESGLWETYTMPTE